MTFELQIEVTDSLSEVSTTSWNSLSDDGNPFLRHEFLHTLDVSGCLGDRTGWYPRYFLLWQINPDNAKELVGATPTYIKTNSRGEFVFDWSWAEAYERHQMDYYPKLVSSIPFTPVTGRRILNRADQPFEATVKLLATAVRQYADSQEFSGAHFLFVTEEESRILSADAPTVKAKRSEASETAGKVSNGDTDPATSADTNQDQDQEPDEINRAHPATDHLARLDCQYHWHNHGYTNFDDFLARCTAKRRKTIRRERRYVSDAELRLEQRRGSSLSAEEWTWVHEFYCSTFDRKWGTPSLTLKFFETIGQLMGDQVLIVFAYDPNDDNSDLPVACSIMFIGSNTLYGRFWGCRAEHHCLHFEACYYQGIEFCIANKITNFEPGAQGEHKITRGFEPTITRSAHYIRHPQFRDAIANFLLQETHHVEQRCIGLSDLLPFKYEK